LISIRKAVCELDRLEAQLRVVAASYGNAVLATAEYSIHIDPHDAAMYRKRLSAIGEQVAAAHEPEHWESIQGSFRNELRVYRDACAGQIARMRSELKGAAEAMQAFADGVTSSGLDHHQQIQEELGGLQAAVKCEDLKQVRVAIGSAVSAIGESVQKMQSSHQLVIAQMEDEMRLLHKQIEVAQRATHVDRATGAWNREKLDSAIADRLKNDEPFCVLLVRLRNLKRLESEYSRSAIEGAIKALLLRFTEMMGAEAVLGRWDEASFAAILEVDPADAIALSREAIASLSRTYSVQENGAWQAVPLQVAVGVIDHAAKSAEPSFRKKLMEMSAALSTA
jgi:GGDEF domain-containing protein